MPFFKKRLRRQRIIKLNIDNTYEEVKLPVDRNKIIDGKNRTMFQPASVFHEKKRFLSLKRPQNLVLMVEGAYKALTFRRGDKYLNPFWTQRESDQFADRVIAHKVAELKPVTWNQVIVIVVALGIVGLLVLKTLMNTGGF